MNKTVKFLARGNVLILSQYNNSCIMNNTVKCSTHEKNVWNKLTQQHESGCCPQINQNF